MEPVSVLLVDDEADLVSAMAERLALRGLQVETATNASAAQQYLRHRTFDVLILDVKMPGTGGLGLMAEVKQTHPELPVILFTGHGSLADAERGMREGAFDYLVKPVDVHALLERIHRAASRKKEVEP